MKTNKKVILVTGGYGFIGSAFLRKYIPLHPGWIFVNLDDHREGSNEKSVADIISLENYRFEKCALEDEKKVIFTMLKHGVTDVIHFAADSNVDHSIREPIQTVDSNVCGTVNLLEGVRAVITLNENFNRFVYISSDEVYGPSTNRESVFNDHGFSESDPLNPTNPYSASKASAEHLVRSYGNTYGVDFMVTRGANTFGPWQNTTKLIPRSVELLKEGRRIELYGKGEATREWIHVDSHVEGIYMAWAKGLKGETYNIGTNVSLSGLEIAKIITDTLAGEIDTSDKITFIEDRLGHDKAYSVDPRKLYRIGWIPQVEGHTLTSLAIASTVKWYWTSRNVPVK